MWSPSPPTWHACTSCLPAGNNITYFYDGGLQVWLQGGLGHGTPLITWNGTVEGMHGPCVHMPLGMVDLGEVHALACILWACMHAGYMVDPSAGIVDLDEVNAVADLRQFINQDTKQVCGCGCVTAGSQRVTTLTHMRAWGGSGSG